MPFPTSVDSLAAMISMYVAVTDRGWFNQLSVSLPEEVNFWQPSGNQQFRALRSGELFLFKLHSPENYIVGGGTFSHASNIQLSIAWEAFRLNNGVASLQDMRARIAHYCGDKSILDPRTDPIIGCRILTQPFFWPRELWIPVPRSFARNIVRGKGYSTTTPEGLALWCEVEARLEANSGSILSDNTARYGEPYLRRPRLGQGAFRIAVTDAYGRRCAVTGERTLPILDAAHIKSYSAGGEHDPANGLLLRTDIHRLFDLGYVTVGEDARFNVSSRLREDFENGRIYYDLQGAAIKPPLAGYPKPASAMLDWHRQEIYLG